MKQTHKLKKYLLFYYWLHFTKHWWIILSRWWKRRALFHDWKLYGAYLATQELYLICNCGLSGGICRHYLHPVVDRMIVVMVPQVLNKHREKLWIHKVRNWDTYVWLSQHLLWQRQLSNIYCWYLNRKVATQQYLQNTFMVRIGSAVKMRGELAISV